MVAPEQRPRSRQPIDITTSQPQSPAVARLARGQVAKSADDNRVPESGDPFIFMAQAPTHTPVGQLVDRKPCWAGDQLLQPTGVAPPERPVAFAAASVSSNSREHSGKAAHLDADVIVTREGVAACEVGWAIVAAPHAPSEAELFKPSVNDFSGVTHAMHTGAGDPPTALQENEQVVLCPMVLPFLLGHLMPSGQIFHAKVGSRPAIFKQLSASSHM